MAGFDDIQVTEDRHSQQGKISETIQNFVADKLIGEPEAVRIDDMVLVDHHCVV